MGLSVSTGLRNAETVDPSAKDTERFLEKADSESVAGVEDQYSSPKPEPTAIPETHFRKDRRRGFLGSGFEASNRGSDEDDDDGVESEDS